MKEVSVIIPTYNRQKWVIKALESVLEQTYKRFDVIVVDDGSEDDSVKELSLFSHQIRLIKHEINLGVSAARNTGIRASDSPLIAFLDSDDRWLPQKLEVQVRYFCKNPGAVACQTQEIWFRKGRRVNPKKRHKKYSGRFFEESLELCLVSPSAVMIKRSLLDEVGLFNESLPVCEDYDLWLRILSKYPIDLIDEEHLIKEGGRSDQLSAGTPGMDKYRIWSLAGLLRRGGLSQAQKIAVYGVLEKKCHIYATGCYRRGKIREGDFYVSYPERLKREFGD